MMNKMLVLKTAYRIKDALRGTWLGNPETFGSFKRAIKSFLIRFSASDGLILTQIYGHSVFVPSSPNLVESYIRRPFEPYTLQLFKSAIKPGAIVLDIGAHLGVYSLVAAFSMRLEGQVFAFEPDPTNFQILRRNIEKSHYRNIVPAQKAVSDACGTFSFFLAESSDCNSFYAHPNSRTKERISVESITVDSFLAGRTVNVIKIDVEGHECKVLRGMRTTILKSGKIILFIELNPACLRSAGATPQELISELEGLGFTMKLINEEAATLVSVADVAILAKRDPHWYGNLYCVKER
ncbi:MAG TPA: FkbM family methyltransferase [Terriglobia bacterium]|nr:FkbM family methyltransferase [Terriglobia bacterium]